MIRIKNIKAPLTADLTAIKQLAAAKMNISAKEILECRLVKKAVDARHKSDIHYVCTIDCRLKNEKNICFDKDIEPTPDEKVYTLPHKMTALPPVIIGTGPAGMLAGLALAEAGLKPLLLERGRDVERRKADVDAFWQSGNLDIVSNVQFGEGGAGTFSDGKLATGIKKDQYTRKVLEEFVAAGAPEEILYLAKPHIGTDKLVKMVKNIRCKIENLGGKYLFEHKMTGFVVQDDALKALKIEKPDGTQDEIACEKAILAIGHSARDTVEMLCQKQVVLEPKPFSVGVRIEQSQKVIDYGLYGKSAGHPALPKGEYQLSWRNEQGRGVYTFCMCPGGFVVASSSEENTVVTNGMSEYARDAQNANAALVVSVDTADYGSGVLDGIAFQRQLEHKAFCLGGSDYRAPAQSVKSFLEQSSPDLSMASTTPSFSCGVKEANLRSAFPEQINTMLEQGMRRFNRKLPGFADADAVITGIETRTSSPVRITRNPDTLQALGLSGLYPCGEGAGYAGGIVSAAVDGVRVAEQVMSIYAPLEEKR